MTSLDRQLRALLGAFIADTGTSAWRLGVEALGDPGFMASLDRGRGSGSAPSTASSPSWAMRPWRLRSGARSRRS